MQAVCDDAEGHGAGTSLAMTRRRPDDAHASTSEDFGGYMLDRQKVEAILRRRFTGTTDQQVAEAANALMGLDQQNDAASDRSERSGRRRITVQRMGVSKGEDR
jgi:hypothetical protein